ncbi:hypothetical protein N7532_006515 [Penicillium argentinense]|uniref:Uncharacterized protein n=1 Tax=Penicillium argentinense TaxID=1131581 RepID=A0A9W9FG54_9EURO|nr:uncharacterized protein N7532_006515 [Penicillium argentinense]KAJ5099514.1 hypothetical protein N7532_006515 [Penicillium argentinense]
MKSSATDLPDGHGSVYKEVRFSPTATPLRRTKSVSGSTPSAASTNYQRAKMSCVPENAPLGLDTSYIDQSRALMDSQRANFERERKLFAQERQLWEQERTLLRTKIAELGSMLKGQKSQSSSSLSHTAKPAFGMPQYRAANEPSVHSAQIWEGSSPGGRPTRVFRDEDVPDNAHLSPTGQGSDSIPPSLDAALSPQSRAIDAAGAAVSVPVPIEKLDSSLDGITLKSSALPPGVVARVITPPSPSSLETSSPATAPSAPARPDMEHRNSLKLKLSELGPPSENLVKNAGHTPMAIIEADVSQRSTKEASPIEKQEQAPEPPCDEEAPLAPMATHVHQPTENRASYFPDLPEDPALKGALGLINDEDHDNSFLSELDQKLLDQAKRILSTSADSGEVEESDPELSMNQGEQEPEIKFRKSTNFGTAFGLSSCGKF